MASKKYMLWKAIYNDGRELNEDVEEFDDLDKKEIKEFILHGQGTTFRHETSTGKVFMDNNELILYLGEDQLGISTDVINYKEKLKMVIGDHSMENDIIGYYTGWKENNEKYKTIEILFWVDMIRQEIKIRVRVNPIKELNDELVLSINGVKESSKLEYKNLDTRHEFEFLIFSQTA